ncbi:sugar transferase [Microbacterium sp. ARD32]|uniref:sugar transferase n=1 Tax=Microbacterium sp. ARD32 TaxID=2962577 RepID=UPI002881E890|nr:sugar transferase [Microbacterium sp. ARD32]MDT0156393.1 sugar transferase [Microbacterium sp. ARD32]
MSTRRRTLHDAEIADSTDEAGVVTAGPSEGLNARHGGTPLSWTRADAHAPAATTSTPRRREAAWALRFALRLVYVDTLIIIATMAGFGALVLPGFGTNLAWENGPKGLPYTVPLTIVGLLWMLALAAFDTRDRHIVGHGVVEYRRVVDATVFVFAAIVVVAFFLRIEVARTLFLFSLPVGLTGLLVGRWVCRQWLRSRQKDGGFVYRAVVLGDRAKIAHIIKQIRGTHGTGYVIVGAVTTGGASDLIDDVPVLGSFAQTAQAIDTVGADTLILTGADELEPQAMRRLGWAMAERDVNWVVAPALTDVAGPRIHAQPVAGLPLVHVDFPRLEGYRRFAKRSFDIVVSTLLIVLTSPIMLATAIAIRVDGPGPIMYTQQRVGRRGTLFSIIKFRSMKQGADDQLASLLDLQGTTDRPFFKVTDDPRITRVGRFIRRYSIDELPQLLNVFTGRMSLVGPRPQRPDEVALYDDVVERRLLVKPGMSGLWQVSGRSQLSLEDSIRLDLYYVENWSFTQDIHILFRTIKAVVAPGKTAH